MRRTGIRYAQTDNPCCAVGKNRFRDVATYLRPLPRTLRLPEKSAFAGKGIGLYLIFQASPENFFCKRLLPLAPVTLPTAQPQGKTATEACVRAKARAEKNHFCPAGSQSRRISSRRCGSRGLVI